MSVSPWCFSGGGRSDLASRLQSLTATDSSPRRVLKIVPSSPEQIAQVESDQALEDLVAEHVAARLQLNPAAAVVEVEEGHLPLPAAGMQAPGHTHLLVGLLAGLESFVRRLGVSDRRHARVGVRERIDPRLPQAFELAAAGGEEFGGLLHRHG